MTDPALDDAARAEEAWAAYRLARRARRIKGAIGILVFGTLAGTLWAMPFAVAPSAASGSGEAAPEPAESAAAPASSPGTLKIRFNPTIRHDDAPVVFCFGLVIAIFLGSIVMAVYESFERRKVAAAIARGRSSAAPPNE